MGCAIWHLSRAYSPPDHVQPGPQGAQHIHNQVMPCSQQAQAWLLSDADKWKGGLPSGTNLQGLDRLLLHLLHAAVGALRQQRGGGGAGSVRKRAKCKLCASARMLTAHALPGGPGKLPQLACHPATASRPARFPGCAHRPCRAIRLGCGLTCSALTTASASEASFSLQPGTCLMWEMVFPAEGGEVWVKVKADAGQHGEQ